MKKTSIKHLAAVLALLTSCTSPGVITNPTNIEQTTPQQNVISTSTQTKPVFDIKKAKVLSDNFELSVKTDTQSPLSVNFEFKK